MKTSIKIALSALGLISLALPSCNAVRGAGQDLSQGGDAISEAASEAKHY